MVTKKVKAIPIWSTILVLDSNSEQWQSFTTNLPDNADLIVLDNSRDGFDQIKSFDQALENGIKYSSVAMSLLLIRQS